MTYLIIIIFCGVLVLLLTMAFLRFRGCAPQDDFYWIDKHGATYSLSYITFLFVYTVGGAFGGLALYALFMPLIQARIL